MDISGILKFEVKLTQTLDIKQFQKQHSGQNLLLVTLIYSNQKQMTINQSVPLKRFTEYYNHKFGYMKNNESKDRHIRSNKNNPRKTSNNSSQKTITPKHDKNIIPNHEPSIKNLVIPKDPTTTQIQAGERLLQFLQKKHNTLITTTFSYLADKQKKQNNSKDHYKKSSDPFESTSKSVLQSSENENQQYKPNKTQGSQNNISFEEHVFKQQKKHTDSNLQQHEYQSQKRLKAKTNVELPLQSKQDIKSQRDPLTPASRSGDHKKKQAIKSHHQKQSSIDLYKGDSEDLKKITLSRETKQALVKFQKYDKQFSKNINEKHLKGIIQDELKRQEKIKSINRNMRVMTFDNQLTISTIANILKYHGQLNKDVRQREILVVQNEQLQARIAQLGKTKNQQIKELKMSLVSKSGQQNNKTRGIDVQIKDFKKTNEILIPVLRQGNYEKARKLLEPQIKKLASSTNKEIALQRKELLQVILNLIGTSSKTQISIQHNNSSSNSSFASISSDLTLLFSAENSIQRNISHLEKCKRQFQPKIQDTRLFQTKQIYQSMSQGCHYLVNLYQELRQKTNTIVSINRKMADMQRVVQRSDRLRQQSTEKGEKIIQGLKDGLERQRRQSREIMERLNSTNKSIKQEKQKPIENKLPQLIEDWTSTLQGIIQKMQNNDSTWSTQLPNLKKKYLNKKQTNQFKSIIFNDMALLQTITKKQKQITKIQQSNQELTKKLASDVKLEFKSSDVQKKYSLEKEKVQQLLFEKQALIKELKDIQKLQQKNKDPQINEILQLNKICYNIDSLLKIPFNKESWLKAQSRIQNRGQFKNLNTIANTIQNSYTKLLDSLSSPKVKSTLSPAVKQYMNQKDREIISRQNPAIAELLQLLSEIIQDESLIQKYVQLVGRIPYLLNLIGQKNEENQQHIRRIQQLQFESYARDNRIQQLELSGSIQTQSRISEVEMSSSIKEHQGSKITLTKQLQDLKETNSRIRQNNYMKMRELEETWAAKQQQYVQRTQKLEQQVKKQKEYLYYKSKMLEQAKKQRNLLQSSCTELQSRNQQLQLKIEEAQKEIEEKDQVIQFFEKLYGPLASSEKNIGIPIQSQIVSKTQEAKQIQSQGDIISNKQECLQLQSNIDLKEEHIKHLKQWIVDKDNIISNLEESENTLKTRIKVLEFDLQSLKSSQAQKTSETNSPERGQKLISESQKTELQTQVKDYYELSQRYRLMFEDCCKQMEELHQTSQDEMESLTEMHLRNQKLLEQEIQILKHEKSKIIQKLEESQRSIHTSQKIIKKQQRQHAIVVKRLENQYSQLVNDNAEMLKQLSLTQEENIKLQGIIASLEKDCKVQSQSGGEMRKSLTNVLEKRKKRLQSKTSNKSNSSQDQGVKISTQLNNLLQTQGNVSTSSLKVIVEAINKLIQSNKKLIQRVRRADKQNNAVYEAISNLTQNQDELGQGFSVIMHLQQVVADIVQWLDDESIATEEDLKLSHFFERLQGCLSKNNYFRYVQIFQQFVQHAIVVAFERSQQQLDAQNGQIDNLRQKLMIALDQHLHDIVEQRQTDGDQAQVLSQVRILLGVYLKTRNLKVIEDLVTILNADEVSFG